MKKIMLFLAALLCSGLFLVNCSISPLAGGGGETTNGIIGFAVLPDGSPSTGAVVRLRPSDYLPGTSINTPTQGIAIFDTITDSDGRFVIHSIAQGTYAIEINDNTQAAVLFHVFCPGDGNTITRPSDTLLTFASVVGVVDTAMYEVAKLRIAFQGLERSLTPSTNGVYRVDDLPEGTYTLQGTSTDTTIPPFIISNVIASSGDTTVIPPTGWQYTMRIYLNTSSAGADVSGNVMQFPVLVRLNSTNFNFTQAQPDGSDIRFTKSDATIPLSFEVERWDAGSQQAALWVKIDTVYGNNNTQSIVMYWGNSSAIAESRSEAVFDTVNGFQGVWHLAEAGNTTSFDATVNHYDGTPINMTTTSSVAGIIGGSQQFDGDSNYITIPNTAYSKLSFPENGIYTVSAWVYVDTVAYWNSLVPASYNVIAAKGFAPHEYILQCKGTDFEFAEYHDQLGWESSFYPATTKNWKLLTAVRAGTRQYLYVDGAIVDTSIELNEYAAPRDSTIGDLTIGTDKHFPNAYFFDGVIDEVRISNVARTAAWIRLSYMNQKAVDALVIFEE